MKVAPQKIPDLFEFGNDIFTVVRESTAFGPEGEVKIQKGEKVKILDSDSYIREPWRYLAGEMYLSFGQIEAKLKKQTAFAVLPADYMEILKDHEKRSVAE